MYLNLLYIFLTSLSNMSSENNQTDETEQLIKNKGGRKKGSIWEYYNESKRKDGYASCKYKYCFGHKFVENLYICKPT